MNDFEPLSNKVAGTIWPKQLSHKTLQFLVTKLSWHYLFNIDPKLTSPYELECFGT